MKKSMVLSLCFMFIAGAAYSFSPTLKNEDQKKYNYKLTCGSMTTHSSIDSNNLKTLSDANCTIAVEGAGSAQLKSDARCVIKNSKITCH